MNRYTNFNYQGNRGFASGILVVIALFLLATGGVAWVSMGIVANDRWPIRWLELNGEFQRVSAEQLRASISPLINESFFTINQQELRGEILFHGKAQCAKCHYGPAFVDDYMHDLKVERFYVGRPEGPIKTFPLRGIKDSPPYLHDGRLPTLHDTVEFFNLVLDLGLTREEKDDLVAYMLCL